MAACWGRKNYMHACWSQLVIGKNMPASWSQFNVLEKYARLLEPIEWGKNNMPACWSQLIVGEKYARLLEPFGSWGKIICPLAWANW